MVRKLRSDGFLDEARTETAGADPDVFVGSVDQRADSLEVWIEDALGLVVGMADVMTAPGMLSAHFACEGHVRNSFVPFDNRRCLQAEGMLPYARPV
jgi:hypothetical protein